MIFQVFLNFSLLLLNLSELHCAKSNLTCSGTNINLGVKLEYVLNIFTSH